MRDGGQFLSGAVAYGLAVSAASTELSDVQAVIWAASAGAMGGFLASVWSTKTLTLYEIVARIVASTMVAPAMVLLALWAMLWWQEQPLATLTLHLFPTIALCGLAGLGAWPTANAVSSIKASEIKSAFMAFVRKQFNSGGTPNDGGTQG